MSDILFDLYKKVYSLSRDQKENLFDNFQSFVVLSMKNKKKRKQIKKILDEDARLTQEDNPYPIENRNGMFEDRTAEILKEARSVHDPETTKEMCNIIELMKKFISVDQDLSYENLCIFLNPLLKGSRRVGLQGNRIIGMVYKLHKLSKKWGTVDKKEKNSIKVHFFQILSEIQKRISEEKPAQKLASRSIFCYRNNDDAYNITLENVNKMLKTHNPQDILRILFYSGSIDFDGKDSIVKELEQMSSESNT